VLLQLETHLRKADNDQASSNLIEEEHDHEHEHEHGDQGDGDMSYDPSRERHCCNTCKDVKEAFVKAGMKVEDADGTLQCKRETELRERLENLQQEGCELAGFVEVNKVSGNFHFAPGHSFQHAHGHHIHEFQQEQAARFNVSHTINTLHFGDFDVPGRVNPLDGLTRISLQGAGVFQYFIKVIPTTYVDLDNNKNIKTNQFAVTEHRKDSGRRSSFVLPGLFFIYDMNPIMVTISKQHTPLLQFMTKLCAIVGGTFTIFGFIDSLIFTLLKRSRNSRAPLSNE